MAVLVHRIQTYGCPGRQIRLRRNVLNGALKCRYTMFGIIDSIKRLRISAPNRIVVVLAAFVCLGAGGTLQDAAAQNSSDAGRNGLVADRFELQWEFHGSYLMLAIDSDLPDSTDLLLTVNRGYVQVGRSEAYSRDYFSERAKLSEWRTPRRITIDDVAWKADLLAHQAYMARFPSDMAFRIGPIEDQIGVHAVVHINQSDPRFGGRGSPNLTGLAVSSLVGNSNRNIVEAKQLISAPFTEPRP